MNEKLYLKHGKNISITITEKKKYIICKNFYLLVYIFAVWESDAENHLSMLLLKLYRDFVV